ncbi:MAG: hypothetical protein P3X24_006210 [bacterium]|nr:hypothetical protein [bacterium]
MAVVVIHGIGVREEGFTRLAQRCEPILRRYLLQPLGLGAIETRWVYWGKHGASFAWDLGSLPRRRVLEPLGAMPLMKAQAVHYTALADLVGNDMPTENLLLQAAQHDLPVLANLLVTLAIADADTHPETLIALYEAARSPDTQHAVQNAHSDDELLQILADALNAQPTRSPERMGATLTESLNAVLSRVAQTISRLTYHPRATLQKLLRPALTPLVAQLMGDVMTYLAHRGERETPGAILQAVRNALTPAPDEPLIVLTHSMGGNIFYDLIHYYAPEVQVNAWVSVAGQVGLFEELKLFKASDPAVRFPNRVAKSPNLGCWLNVYDPVDVLGFAATPIFDGVEDMPYQTGLGWAAHAMPSYFAAPRFYETLAPKLAASLRR